MTIKTKSFVCEDFVNSCLLCGKYAVAKKYNDKIKDLPLRNNEKSKEKNI